MVLSLECGGCGAPSTRWCDGCAAALRVHPDEPHVVSPRMDPGVPVFSLGRYAGARGRAIVAMKEHGRRDLTAPLARALALGIHQLIRWGIVETPLMVVPALSYISLTDAAPPDTRPVRRCSKARSSRSGSA